VSTWSFGLDTRNSTLKGSLRHEGGPFGLPQWHDDRNWGDKPETHRGMGSTSNSKLQRAFDPTVIYDTAV